MIINCFSQVKQLYEEWKKNVKTLKAFIEKAFRGYRKYF